MRRRVERLNKLVKRFSGRHGCGEFRTWKEDLLRAFTLSDITSPVDQVTTISFLLDGDAAEYYHSLTKAVQDDWFELMRVLGQRFDCISHEPVHLSRMLSLKESEFPRHADYVREVRTCVIKSKVNTSDVQMGYLVNSRFVEGLSNDVLEKSRTPPPAPINPKRIRHLEVSTSKERNLGMRLCSRFEGAFCACREDSSHSSVELLVDCAATSDFMSMHTAKRARLPLYKLRNPGHVLTAGGVQVEVRYYTGAYVRVGELVFRHHFKVLEILPDVILGLPWLRSYNPTVNWKERYANIQHGSNLYRLSFGESRHSTQPQFQAASKLDLLSILSFSSSKASPVGNPTPHAKENFDLHSSTHVQHGTDKYDESETEDGITDEECSDMEIELISLPKVKREIHRADLTGDQVLLCCMPRPAVPVDQMYKMQASDGNDDGLDPVRRKLPNRIHKWADLCDREKAESGDLPPHRPGRDHRIRLDLEDNPPWVHPYEMDPSQLDELRRQLDKLH